MIDNKDRLVEVLEKHRGERHLIVLHDYPDPDAISTAYAHHQISKDYDIQTDIIYTGKISHSENIALVKLLNIDVSPYNETINLNDYQGVVFLDHQGAGINGLSKSLESAGLPILIVVDHHEPQNNLNAEFRDIQKTGATATIYTQYIEQGLLSLQKGRKEHISIATALMHGILTDTDGLIRADTDDFQAAGYLSQFRDPDLLEQIMKQARPKQVMDIIRRALGNRTVIENLSIAGTGYLRAEDRDAIPQTAEFLVKEENVHTAIVYGIILEDGQTETLNGSLRTTKLTLDPDKFLKDILGVNPEGRYYGGGKHMAGGFSIPIGFLAGEMCEEYSELKWKVFDAQIKAKIFAKIGLKRDFLHEQHKFSDC